MTNGHLKAQNVCSCKIASYLSDFHNKSIAIENIYVHLTIDSYKEYSYYTYDAALSN